MKLVFDAGALLALERNDRAVWTRLKKAVTDGVVIVTHAGVLGQVWRGGGPRQARLAKGLGSIRIEALDEALGRKAGKLLAVSRSRDVIDAALVRLAANDDKIFTSDTGDIDALAAAADLDVEVIPV